MSDLPYDVWLLVAQYLPDHQVQRLYSVNKALFHIALDVRYRNISIAILPDRVIEETRPPILTNPVVSWRPSSLQITFNDYRPGHHMESKFDSPSLQSLFQSVCGYNDNMRRQKVRAVTPATKLAQLTLDTISQLTRVTHLSFTKARESSIVRADTIIPQVLHIVGPRLRSLHIHALFVMHLPSEFQFASLETFSLDACLLSHKEFHAKMLKKVPEFLVAHESTIRNVSVAFDISDHRVSISPIYECLQFMPCLYNLDFSFSVPYTDFYPLFSPEDFSSQRDAISAHRRHLRSLSINFERSSCFEGMEPNILQVFPQDWRGVIFPNVRTLRMPPQLIFAPEIIAQFSSSLVSLTLNRKLKPAAYSIQFQSRDTLQALCKIIGDLPCLRDLGLSLCGFCDTDLGILGSNLPKLRSLFITYYGISLSHGQARLRPDCLLSWALQSFDYETPEYRGRNGYIARHIAIRVPNILWINKKPRKDWLDEPVEIGG